MNNRIKGYLYATLATFGWGSVFVGGKYAYEVISAGTLLFLRYFLASIVLFIIFRKSERPKIAKEDWPTFLVVGVLGYAIGIWFQQLGGDWADASMASMISTMSPVAVMIFAVWLLKERISLLKLIAIGLTMAGAMVIIGGAGGENPLKGILIEIAAVVVWAYATVLIRKLCNKGYDAAWVTIYCQLIATVACLPFPIAQMATTGLYGEIRWVHILAVLWMGAFCSSVGNLCWNKALEMVEASTCSLFFAVCPVTTVVMGFFLLNEHLTWNFFLGGAIILAGMVLSTRAEKPACVE